MTVPEPHPPTHRRTDKIFTAVVTLVAWLAGYITAMLIYTRS